MRVSSGLVRLWLKPFAFAASLCPAVYMVWEALHNELGADPFHAATRETGAWTLTFLILTLAVSPLRWLTRWQFIIRFRRMTGLFAFFYGAAHFLMYVLFDRFAGLTFANGIVSFSTLAELIASTYADIVIRPFLAIGLVGFLIMVPLALTSSAAMIRRLGGRRWQLLHRFAYLAAIAGVVHHWWPLNDRFRLDSYGISLSALLVYKIGKK